MALTIQSVNAFEILDSRGRPTLETAVTLSDGTTASAQVPSGASTGRYEALELRDGDAGRYRGLGVLKAVAHANGQLAAAVKGLPVDEIDRRMIEADGTANKSRLGANAILSISCAAVRALATARRQPLWQTLAELFHTPAAPAIPCPMVNILSGGHHAEHNIEIQDFLVIPVGFDSYREALRAIVAVHASARELLAEGGYAISGVADEGGWGPKLPSNEKALEILTRAIGRAGGGCAIAIDIASSHFYRDGKYHLASEGRTFEPSEFVDLLERWCAEYPVISLEDGLDQDDWTHWKELTSRLGDRIQLIGDDFFTTNPERVRKGISERAANAVLVKMNQIGTLTETFEVVRLAAEAGWRSVISARSGETEDSFLADLAVATGAGQIKVGSITRSERLAKYNRLLALEQAGALRYSGVPTRAD